MTERNLTGTVHETGPDAEQVAEVEVKKFTKAATGLPEQLAELAKTENVRRFIEDLPWPRR